MALPAWSPRATAAPGESLLLSASPNPPRDSTPVTLHLAGQTAAQQPLVSVYWQQLGGTCPADPNSADPATFLLVNSDTPATGGISDDLTGIFPSGQVQLCAYLADIASPDPVTGNPTILSSASDLLHVQPVHVALALHVPARLDAGEPFTGTVTTAGLPLDAQYALAVDVRRADGAGCAPTRAQEPGTAQDVLSPGDFGSSFGGYFPAYGKYIFCAWVQRLGAAVGTTLAGPVSATILVAPPTGGTPFAGATSQHLAIRFRVVRGEAYAVVFRVRLRCGGRVATHPVVSDPLRAIWLDPEGRFIVDFTGGRARGTIRGRVTGHTARGTLSETSRTATGALCVSGPVTWSARSR